MQAMMFSTLFSPANRVLTAVANMMNQGKPPWTMSEGDPPVTDFLFQVGQRKAVIEVKKSTVLTDKVIHEIVKEHHQFSMGKMKEDSKGARNAANRKDVMSLVSSKRPKQQVRGSRETEVKALEQIVAQMYYEKAR